MNVTLFNGMAYENGIFNLQGGTDEQQSEEKLREDIKILLTQEKGKFYPDVEFGSELQKYMFEPMTEALGKDIQREVREVIEKYYPQLTIHSVDVLMEHRTLNLSIKYSYSDSDLEDGILKLSLFNEIDT